MSGTWRAAPRLHRARLRRQPRIGCARGPRSWRAIMDAISRLSMAVGRPRQGSACNRADVWRWVQHPTWEDGSMQRKDGLCWLPATELARRMRKRQLTAVEVLADHQAANPVFGRTANPWDTKRTPGGSSGGAAAALAAGMTPLEVGSDLVASIRVPAHFCGVYGLKPTEHRVPLTGFFRLPYPAPRPVRIMSCLGPMARDLRDLELALSLIAGPDGYDSDVPPVPLISPPRRPLEGLRLAVAPTPPGATVAKSIRRQVERVAAQASDAGARVEERYPDLDW